jgi:hypothetical protein
MVLILAPPSEKTTSPAHTFEADELTGTTIITPTLLPDGSSQGIPIPFSADPVFTLPPTLIDIEDPALTPLFTFTDDPWRGCWKTVKGTLWNCSEGCSTDGCNSCCDNPDEGTRTCTVYECKEEE